MELVNKISFYGPPGVSNFFKKLLQRESSVPFSGQGVFIKKDAGLNRVVALFSGFFYDHPEEKDYYDQACIYNTSLSDDHRRACKKYSLGLSSYKTLIDYPPEMDKPGTFHPTMAQKVSQTN